MGESDSELLVKTLESYVLPFRLLLFCYAFGIII